MSIIHSHFLGLIMKSVQEQHRENEQQWRLWELSSEPSQIPRGKSHGLSTYSGTALVSPRAIREPVLLQNSRT
jgi:hypothetical protein